MAQIALRGIPDQLHEELRKAAARNHRSVNGEIIARLEESVGQRVLDAEQLMERIRSRWELIGDVDLHEDTLREMKNAGRP